MTLTPKRTGFEIRLRFGKGQRDRFTLSTLDEALALALEPRMEAMARKLADATSDKAREQAHGLLKEACLVASDPKKFAAVERVVSKLCAEAAADTPPAVASAPSTFAEVVDEWCSGRLREQSPDHVKEKTPRGRKIDRATLAVFLPVLGRLPMGEITDEQIAEAKRVIPSGLDPDTRRLYLVRLRTVFKLAIKPLRILRVLPDEITDVPQIKKRNLFWFLYPDEDAQVLGCHLIPLAYRILYGWLNRNGTRITETSMLDYAHLDLVRGRVRLEASWTKTGRARFWDLEPDVLSAMQLWRDLDGKPGPTARVFHTPRGTQYDPSTVSHRFLSDLRLAGVDRDELHITTPGSRRLRVHDTRATFCTMARRRGMPVSWIMDRSGHESAAELEKYSRFVRHADEQSLPEWFAPLDEIIPELFAEKSRLGGPRVGQRVGQVSRPSRKQAPRERVTYSIAESRSGQIQSSTPQKPAENATSVTADTPLWPTSGPAEFKGVGQVGPPLSTEVEVVPSSVGGVGQVLDTCPAPTGDPVEDALVRIEESLAEDFKTLVNAGRYELADKVWAELRDRRLQRSAPAVTSLADARRKREEKP
jgi:integrase